MYKKSQYQLRTGANAPFKPLVFNKPPSEPESGTSISKDASRRVQTNTKDLLVKPIVSSLQTISTPPSTVAQLTVDEKNPSSVMNVPSLVRPSARSPSPGKGNSAINMPFKPVINRSSQKMNYDEESGFFKKQKVELGVYNSQESSDNILTVDKKVRSTLNDNDVNNHYYGVLWRKKTGKKNKTWDGDGIIAVEKNLAQLKSLEGKPLGKSVRFLNRLCEGESLSIGSYETEVERIIPNQEYLAGTLFINSATRNPLVTTHVSTFNAPAKLATTASRSLAQPRKNYNLARHDPNAEGAFILPQPPKKRNSNEEIIDVVVDPLVSQYLRPHQKEGVKFLYECVMGMKSYSGRGALLADDMGLGKTLTTIALLWTLLRQSPYAGQKGVIQRAMIVCPVSLMSNWKKEFKKWLKNSQIGIFVCDTQSNIRDFVAGRVYQIMIVGYERLRTIQSELQDSKIDIVICDEGHRLKTTTNKSSQAILSLKTEKRIILSGTPIQNDLGEFYAMVDFLNPGLLGIPSVFRREFEVPIMKSRQPHAMKSTIEKGKARSEELSRLTQPFIIRRTASHLEKYLPAKTETVLFCKPTPHQASVYHELVKSKAIRQFLGSNDYSDHLRAITLMKKVCNAPKLLWSDVDSNGIDGLLDPTAFDILSPRSGKTIVLSKFLRILNESTNEKVVIASGFTQTLDLLQDMLQSQNLNYLRLDGSVPAAKRQQLVDDFNKKSKDECFAFLLSVKSGGVGLNLVGASRLFLFDTDWNPSVDLQAMARVHRDGQIKPVFIYRLLTTGAMDEKIYQRQIIKQGLADSFMEETKDTNLQTNIEKEGKLSLSKQRKNSSGTVGDLFSNADLQDLFKLSEDTRCQTHDLLGCLCKGIPADFDLANAHSPPISQSQPLDEDEEINDIYIESDLEEEVGKKFGKNITEHEKEQEEYDDDTDGDDLGTWTTASKVAKDGIIPPKRLNIKSRIKRLGSYKHIDPVAIVRSVMNIQDSIDHIDDDLREDEGKTPFVIEDEESEDTVLKIRESLSVIGDSVLEQTIEEMMRNELKSQISFLFTKTNGGNSFRNVENE
ncbi:hypothetical protein NADFUDRAFT_49534 [Nadsonia fulvescens var. elongata DSM 6958]|uniref:DNA-dependent ATPase n=1 Tax=Nadsonia fulvescens var. elongata DSM 6958 TaxID=857566 RepID=A0A1E3PNU9_9ASCO|nr:hypothetical protein NADFUDRAFT_49534 [Nadsonia fulvescens var. elongata DSM 6958]